MFIDEGYSNLNIKVNKMSNSKYSFLNQLDLDADVIQRLSQYLDLVVRGNSNIYVTPIAKDHNPETILKEWDSIYNANKDKINVNLDNLEMSNRMKFGPRSIAKPWKERKDDTLAYFKGRSCNINLSDLITNEKKESLRPISLDRASQYLRNSSNSGLPYFKKKGLIKTSALQNFDKIVSKEYPCILFTRTQEGNKTRDVWGYPIADTLRELMYYHPLLNYQKVKLWRAALRGPSSIDDCVSKMLVEANKLGFYLLSIDFSKYDKTVQEYLQRMSFNYIKSKYQASYHDNIDNIAKRFNTIGIVHPSGITSGSHGVPSGSTFTNEVDSIAQYLIASKSGVVIPNMLQIQGDDGCYVLKSQNDVDRLFKTFEEAGLDVNRDKSYVSKDFIVYLQCLYDIHYNNNNFIGGIYPTYRALNRILFQEHYSDFEEFGLKGIDYYSIRTLSILENCKYHPLFKEFVQFIKKYDKYSLKFSQDGLNKYNFMSKQENGTVGVIINQHGDVVSGLRNFEAYKIANYN